MHVGTLNILCNLGLEVFYQLPFKIVLLLVATTTTSTTGGLETMFKQKSMFGIPMNPTTVLALSIALSMRSCVNLHQKTVQVHKGFFPLASEISVWIWGLFGALRRILAMVSFFIPFLGLFDVLQHWKAEQLPFWIR